MTNEIRTVRLGLDLSEAVELRWKNLGYPSRSAYLVALIRADSIEPANHELAQRIAMMAPSGRDKIDQAIANQARHAVPVFETESDRIANGIAEKRMVIRPPAPAPEPVEPIRSRSPFGAFMSALPDDPDVVAIHKESRATGKSVRRLTDELESSRYGKRAEAPRAMHRAIDRWNEKGDAK